MNSQQANESLRKMAWKQGAIFTITEGPYRHRVVAQCSLHGRQKALFANGEHPYFCYLELLDENNQRIKKCTNMVPILPDGRFIMVVEQRPAHDRYTFPPMFAKIDGKNINLDQFGPHSSLEFPGGAINSREELVAGFVRELIEESEAEEQTAKYYSRYHPVHQTGADIALQQYLTVVFLSGLHYQPHVKADGGLTVMALTKNEVQENIWRGVICSGQAALLPWGFYKEIEEVLRNPEMEKHFIKSDYLTVGQVQITKPNRKS